MTGKTLELCGSQGGFCAAECPHRACTHRPPLQTATECSGRATMKKPSGGEQGLSEPQPWEQESVTGTLTWCSTSARWRVLCHRLPREPTATATATDSHLALRQSKEAPVERSMMDTGLFLLRAYCEQHAISTAVPMSPEHTKSIHSGTYQVWESCILWWSCC